MLLFFPVQPFFPFLCCLPGGFLLVLVGFSVVLFGRCLVLDALVCLSDLSAFTKLRLERLVTLLARCLHPLFVLVFELTDHSKFSVAELLCVGYAKIFELLDLQIFALPFLHCLARGDKEVFLRRIKGCQNRLHKSLNRGVRLDEPVVELAVQLAFFFELLLLLVVLECGCRIRTHASVSLFLQILNALLVLLGFIFALCKMLAHRSRGRLKVSLLLLQGLVEGLSVLSRLLLSLVHIFARPSQIPFQALHLAGLLPHVVGGVLDFLALDLTFLLVSIFLLLLRFLQGLKLLVFGFEKAFEFYDVGFEASLPLVILLDDFFQALIIFLESLWRVDFYELLGLLRLFLRDCQLLLCALHASAELLKGHFVRNHLIFQLRGHVLVMLQPAIKLDSLLLQCINVLVFFRQQALKIRILVLELLLGSLVLVAVCDHRVEVGKDFACHLAGGRHWC
mmetsp:Transcript_32824/g.52842  ORF Transcript_32824/g.52842 Transcript_32824/m.52842 type:complete len:451 (+) Transcript_32824:1332-2684(+)